MDYINTYDDSEIDMSKSLNDLGANDGYHGSDTAQRTKYLIQTYPQLHSTKTPINLRNRWKKDTFRRASFML